MNPLKRIRLDEAGFTIHEILLTSVLGALACSLFLSFSHFQFSALHNQANQVDLQTTARNVVDLFAREVRRAGKNPSCAAFSAIAEARTSKLRVQSDLNGNGAIDGTNEDLTYQFNPESDTITRETNEITDILVSDINVAGSRLRYYDGSGTELVPAPALTQAERDSVRRVRLELAMRGNAANPGGGAPLRTQVSTDVDLRNRFFVSSTACP